MAAGYLSQPGTEFGPCELGCEHTDCAATRKMAETICPSCDKPIGYETGFYQEGEWKVLRHALCVEMELDKAKEAQQ